MPQSSNHEGEIQASLIRFLTTDLQLAFTELRTAEVESGSHPDHSRFALAKAREALKMIRRFESRIEDPGAAEEIQARADALESALKRFQENPGRTS